MDLMELKLVLILIIFILIIVVIESPFGAIIRLHTNKSLCST